MNGLLVDSRVSGQRVDGSLQPREHSYDVERDAAVLSSDEGLKAFVSVRETCSDLSDKCGFHAGTLAAYQASEEAKEWRRTHTWGGFLWPIPEEDEEMGVKHASLQGAELFEEIDWLLDGDVHPLLIAQAVSRTSESIVRAARRHGRPDLVLVFTPYASEEKLRRTRRAS